MNGSGFSVQPGPIVSLGDLVADIVIELSSLPIGGGDFQHAQRIVMEPGGSANFLITASRLGAEVHALGTLGNDNWGDEVGSILTREKVDISEVRVDGTTTVVLVLVGPSGEHAFIGKYGEGERLSADDTTRSVISGAQAVFGSGYSLQDKRVSQFTLELFRHASYIGVQTFFDPGPMFFDQTSNVKESILSDTAILLLTEEELKGFGSDPIETIFKAGPEVVVLKRGAEGCSVYQRGGDTFSAKGLEVPVRDTTAAGDSYDAGFVVGMLHGWPLMDCAKFANAVGAAKVQKLGGGRNVPTLAEVRRTIAAFNLQLDL
jgi:sugar/nucleoside kinase (ribokinase family)